MKNKLLFTATLFLFATNIFSQVPNYVPTNGLVGYWPFNGNAIDESINTNDGTVNGATLTTDRFGVVNSAYSFDGLSNYIDVGNPSLLQNVPSSYTQSGWAYYNDYSIGSNGYTFISKRHDNSGNDWATPITKSDGTIIFFADDAFYTGAIWAQTNPLSLNQWHFLTFVKSFDNYFIYVDGSLVSSIVDAHIMGGSTNNLIIGAQLAWPQYMKGSLDDIGIWNRALTQCEIQDLYNSQLGSANTSSTLNQTALDSYTLNGQTYTQSGTYNQVIPNAAGCDSTITLNLTLSYTGITELKDGIRIYPNPTFDNLTIERTSALNSNYVLVDSQGRLVLQGDLTETITNLSLGKLEYGNYILQLENQSVPIRIVKQ